jgi:hypothetical protein
VSHAELSEGGRKREEGDARGATRADEQDDDGREEEKIMASPYIVRERAWVRKRERKRERRAGEFEQRSVDQSISRASERVR